MCFVSNSTCNVSTVKPVGYDGYGGMYSYLKHCEFSFQTVYVSTVMMMESSGKCVSFSDTNQWIQWII